tara:strand:- start:229 stop:759 length:531 start_codon:yes stop_codon:yes gene_type:complete
MAIDIVISIDDSGAVTVSGPSVKGEVQATKPTKPTISADRLGQRLDWLNKESQRIREQILSIHGEIIEDLKSKKDEPPTMDERFVHDWLIFLGEDNPIGCDIAIHKSMVGRHFDSADCSTPDPEEGVTRFGPGCFSIIDGISIDDLHFDVHHVWSLWDHGFLNDDCINIFKAQGGK